MSDIKNNKTCHHIISINLPFLKRVLGISTKTALTYSTPFTKVDIQNDMSKEDLMKLANWIITSGVARVETETRKDDKQ
jgi:hypothetical protein